MLDNVSHFVSDDHPHIHVFETADPAGCIIYRTDTLQQAACSPDLGRLLRAVLSGEADADLLPGDLRHFVFAPPPGPLLSEALRPATTTAHLDTLYVMPTLNCQLRCNYCRIVRKQGHQEGFRLSPEEAVAALDRFIGALPEDRRRTVVLFGGEPLLVRDTTFAVIQRARTGPGGRNATLMIQTNAVAIDDETARFLADHDVFVLASIDGPREVHNRHRVLADGEGSFDRTMEGYTRARQAGCRVGFSATVTKETADWFETGLADFLDELRPDRFGIGTHLHPLADGRSPHQCSPEQAARIFVNAYLAARERGIHFIQMNQKIEPFITATRRRYSCAGCAGKVVVAPNGTAGLCEYNAADGRSFVRLDQFSADTVADFARWANRSPLETPDCLKCPALAICGGGCAYDSQMIMGDALAYDPWFCETNVLVSHWMMHDLLAHLDPTARSEDFHLITTEERLTLLGRIPPSTPIVIPAQTAHCETCACTGDSPSS